MTDPDALQRARQQLTIHLGLLLTMFAAHAVATSWLVLARLGVAFDPLALAPPIARGVFQAWLVLGTLWTAVSVRGLLRRRPWARRSALWYWVSAMPLCCCIPIPTWAVWSLTRPAMKKLLDVSR